MTTTFKFLFLSVATCLTLTQSCKNEDKKVETSTNENTQTSVQKEAALVAGPFTVLKLDKNDLAALFSDNSTKKILLQFSNDPSQDYLSATAFNAKSTGDYNNLNKQLSAATTGRWDTSGLKILGNNELTIKQVKVLLGISGQINPANSKDLYFYPKKDANNQILFIASTQLLPFTTGDINILINYPLGGEYTKPSPPAPPCNPCD